MAVRGRALSCLSVENLKVARVLLALVGGHFYPPVSPAERHRICSPVSCLIGGRSDPGFRYREYESIPSRLDARPAAEGGKRV